MKNVKPFERSVNVNKKIEMIKKSGGQIAR